MSATNSLPIEAIKDTFCQALSDHNTVILSAPPGAGKSTCLPLWLLQFKPFSQQKIYLLQPRRLAVKNIATYLANQLNENVGETVGYRLRNDSKVSKTTRLEVITEGILTQIIQQDAELTNCALVVFDEFHERSLQGDLAFALTRDVQQGLREDLKILLMSATLDIDYLNKALPDAKTITSAGRSFPVELSYNAPVNIQRWRDHALSVIKHQAKNHQGSILVFLPGVADIRFIANAIEQTLANTLTGTSSDTLTDDLLLCPLFGDLTLKQQQQAISPCKQGKRKLVLATNIAETSLTIEGVNLVIDCGLEKVAVYDSASLMNKLVQKQIAKASAVQRAGRAGRLMAGACIRLYAKDEFERRSEQSINEIAQADLLPTLIEAARWGVTALANLPLLELPTKIKEQQAWQELQSLAIINKNNKLTKHGEKVAQLPCHPRFAHMLLSAKQNDDKLAFLACIITALLETRDLFVGEQSRYDCNLIHRINLLITRWRTPNGAMVNIVKQVKSLAKRLNISDQFIRKQFISEKITSLPIENTGLLLAYAYPERVAKARGKSGEYICANGKGVALDEQDALAAETYLVVADLMQLKNGLRVRLAASIELAQIEQIFSDNIIEKEVATFDGSNGKIIARSHTKLAAIILKESVNQNTLTTDQVSLMWCELVKQKGLNFLNWHNKDLALKARWQWLTHYFPNYDLPKINHAYLLENMTLWFAPFVGEIKSTANLAKVDLSTMLLSLLDYSQQQILKQAAPTVYVSPTGRHCAISYSMEKSPKVSLPMQELYGLTETPTIGATEGNQKGNKDGITGGKSAKQNKTHAIPLILELLSPAQRPIQVTQDLAQFWAGSYKAVQKEMKSKYPRHYWPDDPVNAKPTNKTKRHLNL